eukprot:CAMPEP_0181031258 /NCGR_PEP_ID=MMETSP1070-20121207/6140_1 /TAXON_ID=265543 /ORGANISM="Minutocellus polymorphus, Strain NH13" /LENGTH=668 /DNA_ID=CAMNT_0023108631 /DNA_START=64 /DNA_END=2070 /DNA_ORIENTATION=+
MEGDSYRQEDDQRWSSGGEENHLESQDDYSNASSDTSDNDSRRSSSSTSSSSSVLVGGSSKSSYYSSDEESDGESYSSSSFDSGRHRHNAGLADQLGAFRDTLVRGLRHRRNSRTPANSRHGSDHAGDVHLRIDEREVCDGEHINDDNDDDDSPYHHNRKRRRPGQLYNAPVDGRLGKVRRILCLLFRIVEHRAPETCGSKKATVVLVCSVLLWLLARIRADIGIGVLGGTTLASDEESPGSLLEKLKLLRQENDRDSHHALGSAAGDYRKKTTKNRKGGKKKDGVNDKLPAGCAYPPDSWVIRTHPNCNEIHEIDLRQGYNPRRRNIDSAAMAAAAEGSRSTGYVGSGLWRDVWKVDPRGEVASRKESDPNDDEYDVASPAVLKAMKQEHPYDFRNNDRHRRDALVMERLSSSKYVVDIYAYCGNSVLSEYVGRTLDDIIYHEENLDEGKETPAGKELERLLDRLPEWTRDTPPGRIRLALDVFRGISELHEIDGGPIVHADLQAKQFLVDPSTKTIRINDFNRCRMLPRKDGDKDGESCAVKIPSAPGANRSPEEYSQMKLTEKIDVYSGANVLYGILTGRRHFADSNNRMIKKLVMNGQKPPIPDEFKVEPTDKALADLIDRAYERNPRRRISASEMVRELEELLPLAQDSDDEGNGGKDSLRKK